MDAALNALHLLPSAGKSTSCSFNRVEPATVEDRFQFPALFVDSSDELEDAGNASG